MRLGRGVLYLVFHRLIVDSKVDVLLMTVPNGNMGCQLSRGIQNYILRSIGPNNPEPVQDKNVSNMLQKSTIQY